VSKTAHARSALLAAAAVGLAAAPAQEPVRPQDDLFLHVNAGWLAGVEVPADRVSYGAFHELADRVEADVLAIIEDLARRPNRKRGTPSQQIVDLYASLMDQARLDDLGIAPIREELARIEAIRTPRELAAQAGRLSAIGAGGPLLGSVAEDPMAPGRVVFHLTQVGLLLPERDDYSEEDPPAVTIRARYLDYLATVFTRIGRPDPTADARAVLAVETELARARPDAAPARFTLAQLAAEMPGFDWPAWAKPQGVDRAAYVLVSQPSSFEAFAAAVARLPLEAWKAWLAARYVTASAPFLDRTLEDARFEFFGRVLTGQERPRARSQRGVSLVSGYLTDAVGRLYAEKRFSPEAKARVEALVGNVLEAYRRAIGEADWMSKAARREALEKLRRMEARIGRPERWRDYGGLAIKADDLFGNIQRAQKFENDYRMSSLRTPGGRGEWPVGAQTVSAYYWPGDNAIVLPAGLLQPPFFDPHADDAVNYGGLGAVVGHEITHAFDERGRWTDAAGALRDWWRPQDEQEFRKRAALLVEQFDAMSPGPGLRVSGERTVRENIGDLVGLEMAFRAYRLSLAGRRSPVIDGTTGEQRFFMSWARIWRARIRDEYLRQWLLTNPHAPPQFRVNGAVVHLSGFYDAFGVEPGDRLYRGPERRVKFW
jgi:predicted metalloendopeptidase